YRPLSPYDREDRALFTGRDADVTAFGDLLDDGSGRLLLLHGEPDVGKSSFLRAGVIPYVEDYGVGYRALRDRRPDETGSGSAANGETRNGGAEADEAVLAIRSSPDPVGQIAEALCAFCAQPYSYTTPTGKTVSIDLPGILRSGSGSTAIQEGGPPTSPSLESSSAAPPEPSGQAPDAVELWRRMNADPSLLGRLLTQITDQLPHELVI